MARFIDSHAHLDASQFTDLDEILTRARDAGLTDIVCIGASDGFESNPKTLAIAERHPSLHATVGIHPHDAKIVNDDVVDRIRALAAHEKVVAIGEVGLDYHYDYSPRPEQREAFQRFLTLSKEVDRPVVIHTREAEDDTIAIMRDAGAEAIGGVIHCFTGTEKLAEAAIDMGFYISFSGVVTFNSADRLRGIAKDLPRDRVLVETDCPFLAPMPLRGKTNEPSFIVHTVQRLADLWEVELADVKEATSQNAASLFGI